MDDVPMSGADELLLSAGWARALARRLVVDEARADDLLQQAWLAARARPASERRSPRAWLAGVLKNVASKQRREEERRTAREEVAARAESQPSSSSVVAELEAQRLVVDALLKLDEPYRETLVRRWYRDEKPAAIACAMGVPVKTVDTRLARGLERLRAELTELRGGSRREWGLALMPLAIHAPAAKAAVVLGSLAAGVATMSTVSKLAAAALVVAAAAWWGWRESGGARPAAAGRGGSDEPAAMADAARARGEDSRAATAAMRTPSEEPRDPAPRVAPDDGMMVVHLVDPDGVAVDAARFLMTAGDRYLEPGAIVPGHPPRIAAPPVDVTLLVHSIRCSAHVAAAPCTFDVGAEAKSLELRLPRGGVLSGQLLCDGRAPGVPLTLSFEAEQPFAALHAVPDAVRHQMGLSKSTRVDVVAGDDGCFRITGLDVGVRGVLTLPEGWSAQPITAEVDGRLRVASTLPIAAPTEGMRIELFSAPALTGSFVDAGGASVESFTWVMSGESESGRFSSRGSSERSRAFHLPLPVAAARSVDLSFEERSARSGAVHLHLDGPFGQVRDLGPVRLLPNRTARLHVTDASGREVGKLFWVVTGPVGERRNFSGDEADIEIDAAAVFDRVRVGARGYLPCEIELPESGGGEVISVHLKRTTELRVRAESGKSVVGTVEVAARGELFEPAMAALDLLGAAHDMALGSATTDADGWTRLRVGEVLGGVSVFGLVAGVPIRVRLVGRSGHVGYEGSVVLATGESRELVVEVDGSMRHVAGRVVDSNGEGIADAVVQFRADAAAAEYGGVSTATTPDGFFTFGSLLGDTTRLSVTHPGFVSLDLSDFRLPAADEPITLRLERAWPLRVKVVDAAGRPLDEARVTARAITPAGGVGEKFCDAWPDGPGNFRFEDLASGSVRVQVDLAGAKYEQDAAPPTASLRFELPQHGRVVVRYDLAIPEAAKHGRVLGAIELAPREGHGTRVAVDATLFDPPRRAGAVEFPAVLPGSYEIVLVWRDEDGHDLEREATGETLAVVASQAAEAIVTR